MHSDSPHPPIRWPGVSLNTPHSTTFLLPAGGVHWVFVFATWKLAAIPCEPKTTENSSISIADFSRGNDLRLSLSESGRSRGFDMALSFDCRQKSAPRFSPHTLHVINSIPRCAGAFERRSQRRTTAFSPLANIIGLLEVLVRMALLVSCNLTISVMQ